YVEPSYKLSDMSTARFVGKIFGLNDTELQLKIDKLKSLPIDLYIQHDLKLILSNLSNDISSSYQLNDFQNEESYKSWKSREFENVTNLLKKIFIPNIKQLSDPKLNSYLNSKNNLFIPNSFSKIKIYFTKLIEYSIDHDSKNNDLNNIFSNTSYDFLQEISKFWRIDYFTRCSLIYTACHNTVLNMSPASNYLDIARDLYSICERISSLAGFELDPITWPHPDRDVWLKNLFMSYTNDMESIKECLSNIFDYPKFGSFTTFYKILLLDSCFIKIRNSKFPKKWLKTFKITLAEATIQKYREILSIIPRDQSAKFDHLNSVATEIISIIQTVQLKYKKPLLDNLYRSTFIASQFLSAFSNDAKTIIDHIERNTNKDEIVFSDAIELYKNLSEIRSIYFQVMENPKRKFPFDIENYLFKYALDFVNSSAERVPTLIQNAFNEDNFQLDSTNKVSFSVIMIFKMLNQLINSVRDLGWQNKYQEAVLITNFVKVISDGLIYYSNLLFNMVVEDLREISVNQNINATNLSNSSLPNEEESSTNRFFNQFKAAVSSKKVEPPNPYQFKERTCVALNNLQAMLDNINKLDEQINPESMSQIIKENETNYDDRIKGHLFTVRVLKAENLRSNKPNSLPDTTVSIYDAIERRQICKTKLIKEDFNPEWDEEFELAVPAGSMGYLFATIWDYSSAPDIIGRAEFQLEPSRYDDDGLPQEIWVEFAQGGKLLLEISMESERIDALFCLGKAFRSIARTRDRIAKLMVSKFSTFISFAFSRDNLKIFCGSNESLRPTDDSAMDILGDYLNANLSILATSLTHELLLKVMVETWEVVLTSADELLLPSLNSVKNYLLKDKISGGFKWKILSNQIAKIGKNTRALTMNEIDTIFSWLDSLCSFFYNDGDGPPLKELKGSAKYQLLFLIPINYDSGADEIIKEVEGLSEEVLKELTERNYFDINDSNNSSNGANSSNAGTIARSKTVMANGSARARKETENEAKKAKSIISYISKENILLRILITKGEYGKCYVAGRIDQREELANGIHSEKLAKAISQ
ncbi:uncharacterized protein ASCRUDRAFT_21699, partial [Ascoidea rubescens DSM 1968]